jgi:hypothetical protein
MLHLTDEDRRRVLESERLLASDVGGILAQKEPWIGAQLRLTVVAAICARVTDFRMASSQKAGAGGDVPQWRQRAAKRMNDLLAFLDSSPDSALARGELNQLRVAAVNFKESICGVDSGRDRGRPVNWDRRDLEEEVGGILAVVGVSVTMAPDGTFAEILRNAIYPAIGFKSDHSPNKAVRAAIDRNPQWADWSTAGKGGNLAPLCRSKRNRTR